MSPILNSIFTTRYILNQRTNWEVSDNLRVTSAYMEYIDHVQDVSPSRYSYEDWLQDLSYSPSFLRKRNPHGSLNKASVTYSKAPSLFDCPDIEDPHHTTSTLFLFLDLFIV